MTAPIQTMSVMGTRAQSLAGVGVGDGQAKKTNGEGDEDEVGHALLSRDFDVKPQRVTQPKLAPIKMP